MSPVVLSQLNQQTQDPWQADLFTTYMASSEIHQSKTTAAFGPRKNLPPPIPEPWMRIQGAGHGLQN
jgi:hypothetical protein